LQDICAKEQLRKRTLAQRNIFAKGQLRKRTVAQKKTCAKVNLRKKTLVRHLPFYATAHFTTIFRCASVLQLKICRIRRKYSIGRSSKSAALLASTLWDTYFMLNSSASSSNAQVASWRHSAIRRKAKYSNCWNVYFNNGLQRRKTVL
jgi:hypothetical protein